MAVTNNVINNLSEVLAQHCLFYIIYCTYWKNNTDSGLVQSKHTKYKKNIYKSNYDVLSDLKVLTTLSNTNIYGNV
jgi:hypothetical protein